LFDNLNKSSEEAATEKSPIVLSSIVSEKSLQQYENITHRISQVFADIQKGNSTDALMTIANIICQYVTTTPCVMGYTLRQDLKNTHHEKLINHSMSVAIISGKIAKLLGYSSDKLQIIVLGALLHDIGKTKLPDHIANTTSFIRPEDEKLYQSHVHVGYDLIKSLNLPREVTLIVVQHHEYHDGSGFPLHIKTEKIHPYAQIVAFADMFDGLVHENSELPNFFDIRSRLITNGANKISPPIIDVFDRYLNDFIFNINVELSDGRTAEVIYTHPSYMSFVVRTTDGDFIDLSKDKTVFIKKTFL
ncbi:MAG: HD domain-containing protein, partial [Sporomusaceae bacterium]|nr:HD domain-containing protein [Sporomusaceae bacterium]